MPHDPGTPGEVAKGFVEVGGKLVHYVRRGEGPPLVMLHASPCSARVMAPLQAAWRNDFTTVAFDLPGFGLSELPDAEPLATAHLADMVADAVRALGFTRVAFYGRHTGAGVAVELASRHPELASFVLTDGFPVFANPYAEERLAEYLPPIEPRWDGGHLVWAFFRYREQHVFWPWDRPLLENRADTDVPDLPSLYRGTIELLEAAPTYRKVYATAFRHPGLAMIDRLTVPVCFGNRPGDSQFKTMRLYPAGAWTREFSREEREAAAEELAVLKEHVPPAPAAAHRGRFLGGRQASLRDYLPSRWGAVYGRGAGLDRPGAPIVLLHDLPGGADLHAAEIDALGERRPTLAFDFLGNGHSVIDTGEPVSIDLWAEQVAAVLDTLGHPQVHLYAVGTAAAVAQAFAWRRPASVLSIVYRSPPVFERDQAFVDSYAPDISPAWDGGNFLRLWHHLRDQELWWPWHRQTLAQARRTPPRIDPADFQRRALTMLRQPGHYRETWRAVLAQPLRAAPSDRPVRQGIVTHEGDLFAFAADAAGALFGTAPHRLESGDASAFVAAWTARDQ